MVTPSKFSVKGAERAIDLTPLDSNLTSHFERRSKSIDSRSVRQQPFVSLLRVDTQVKGLHALKQRLKFPELTDSPAPKSSKPSRLTPIENGYNKSVSRSYLLAHTKAELQGKAQQQASKNSLRQLPFMSAVDTSKINEGRHKQSMAFNDESQYSIINMINYQNYSTDIGLTQQGKLKVDPYGSSGLSNYSMGIQRPFLQDQDLFHSDPSVVQLGALKPIIELRKKREFHQSRLSEYLPTPRLTDFSTKMLDASEMLRDNLVKSQLIEQFDLQESDQKPQAKGAFNSNDPLESVKHRNSLKLRFKSQSAVASTNVATDEARFISPLHDPNLQHIVSSMTKVSNDEALRSQRSMSDEDEKGGGARLKFGSSSLEVINEHCKTPLKKQPMSPTKQKMNYLRFSPQQNNSDDEHGSGLSGGACPHMVKQLTVATSGSPLDGVKKQTAASVLTAQIIKPLFPPIEQRIKFEKKQNEKPPERDTEGKLTKAGKAQVLEETEKKRRIRNAAGAKRIKEQEAELAQKSHLIDVDMEKEIEDKIQQVYAVMNKPVDVDKQYMSFSEINAAYQNKIMMTGQAIVKIVEEEKDEVEETLKIIEFQQKLQKDNTTYLGHQGYDKVKAVYEKIQKAKKEKQENSAKEEAKKKADAIEKALEAAGSDSQTKDTKPNSMMDAMERIQAFKRLAPAQITAEQSEKSDPKSKTQDMNQNSDIKSILRSIKGASEQKEPAKVALPPLNLTRSAVVSPKKHRSKQSSSIPLEEISEQDDVMSPYIKDKKKDKENLQTQTNFQQSHISNLQLKQSPTIRFNKRDEEDTLVDEMERSSLSDETSSIITDEELYTEQPQNEQENASADNLENYKVYKQQKSGEYKKRESMEDIIATKKIYPMMREFNFQYSSKVADEYESYDIDKNPIKKFIRDCHKLNDHQNPQFSAINPFPILHQAYHGRYLLRNQCFPMGANQSVLSSIIALEYSLSDIFPPIHTLFLEGNKISDEELANMIKMVQKVEDLREIVLVRMKIGVKTQVAINLMQKEKVMECPGFFLHFEQCDFTEYNPSPEKHVTHPMLISHFKTVKHLTLINQQLDDSAFEKLIPHSQAVDTLDISFNWFTNSGVIKFLKKLTDPSHTTKMKSLVMAGNAMNIHETSLLDETLEKVLHIPGLQHLDLSLTKIEVNTQEKLIKHLLLAETLVALHLTTSDVEHLRTLSLKHLVTDPVQNLFDQKIEKSKAQKAHQVVNRMNRIAKMPPVFDAKWNDEKRIPHAQQIDITQQVKRGIAHLEHREDFCSQNSSNTTSKPKAYWQQSYVLQRLIGRSECDLMSTKQPDQVIVNEDFEKVAQTCWIEARECWHCERWNYLLPVVTKDEMEGCFDGTGTQSELCLTRQQQQIFDKIVDFNKEKYSNLKLKVPYIVGTMTEYFIREMDNWADFMLRIDPKADQIKKRFYDVDTAIETYYKEHWKENVFAATPDSSMEVVNKTLTQVKKKLAAKAKQQEEGGQKTNKTNSVWPYMPKFERQMAEKDKDGFFEWDSVWTYPTMCVPGRHTYFIVYRIDENKTFVTQMSTQVSIRSNPIHSHKMQVPQRLFQKMQDKSKNRQIYFDVFKKFKPDKHDLLDRVFKHECKMWPATRKLFGVKSVGQIDEIKKEMGQYLPALFTLFRHLAGLSESYPLLGFKEMKDWVKNLNIIDQRFTAHTLSHEFSQTKTFEYKRDKSGKILPIRQDQKIRAAMGGMTDKANNPGNELTRYHFFEFVTRMAVHKYIRQKKKIGARKEEPFTPLDCIHKFMLENVLPSMKKTLMNYQKLENFKTEQIFMNNTELRKMLFVNQFQLKQIYNILIDQQAGTEFAATDFSGNQDLQGTLKKATQAGSFKMTFGTIGGGNSEPQSPRSRSPKNRASSGDDLASIGSDFEREVEKDKDSPKNQEESVLKTGEIQITEPSFQLTGNKLMASLMTKHKASLKKKVAQAEKPTLKALDLPKGLHLGFVLTRFQRLLPDVSGFLDIKLFRKCMVHAKQTNVGYGENRKQFEMDVDRDSRLTFVEFMAFICVLAKMVYSPTQPKIGNDAFNEDVRYVLKALFTNTEGRNLHFEEPGAPGDKSKKEEVKVLIDGHLTNYREPTPVSQRRSIMPDFRTTNHSLL